MVLRLWFYVLSDWFLINFSFIYWKKSWLIVNPLLSHYSTFKEPSSHSCLARVWGSKNSPSPLRLVLYTNKKYWILFPASVHKHWAPALYSISRLTWHSLRWSVCKSSACVLACVCVCVRVRRPGWPTALWRYRVCVLWEPACVVMSDCGLWVSEMFRWWEQWAVEKSSEQKLLRFAYFTVVAALAVPKSYNNYKLFLF